MDANILDRPATTSVDEYTSNDTSNDTSNYMSNYLNRASGGVQWSIFKPDAPTRITMGLLDALASTQDNLLATYAQDKAVRYHVLSSDIPGIFSLGGDLELFSKCAFQKDRKKLRDYAIKSVEVIYQSSINYNLPITTISLIKGAALGGGFEAALSFNTIIAERQSTFSFPETRFGLFPGMGAYTFLRQRVTPRVAEEIIYSSKTYTADELYKIGVIDVVCEEGQGYKATMQYIQQMNIRHQGIHAMRQMVQKHSGVDKQELLDIVEHWVECVMRLSEKQLRLITMLSKTSINTYI